MATVEYPPPEPQLNLGIPNLTAEAVDDGKTRDEKMARKIGVSILGQTHNIDYYKRGTKDMIERSESNALRHQYLTSIDLDAPFLNAGEDYDN